MKKPFQVLDSIKEKINQMDQETLEASFKCLEDLAEIQRMQETIIKMEDEIVAGKGAIFYFFAKTLEPDQLPLAAASAKGRITHLNKQKEIKEAAEKKAEELKAKKNGTVEPNESAESSEPTAENS